MNSKINFKASPTLSWYLIEAIFGGVMVLGVVLFILGHCNKDINTFSILFGILFFLTIPTYYNCHTLLNGSLIIRSVLWKKKIEIKNIEYAKESYSPGLAGLWIPTPWFITGPSHLFVTTSTHNLVLLKLRKPVKVLWRKIDRIILNVDEPNEFIGRIENLIGK